MHLKVGELARSTGLTVRTLHHYDEIGLLKPTGRSGSGYRMYGAADVARLHAIQALRHLGLPLAKIGPVIDGEGSMERILEQQMHALQQQIRQASELHDRLALLRDKVLQGPEPQLADWVQSLSLMSTYGKYFGASELKVILANWGGIEGEWNPLLKEVRAFMDRGGTVDSAEGQALAWRWMTLMHRWMAGDFERMERWGAMYRSEPAAHGVRGAPPTDMMVFMERAIALRMQLLTQHFGAAALRRIRQLPPEEWKGIETEGRRLLAAGLGPRHPATQALLPRWLGLLERASAGDPEVRRSLQTLHTGHPLLLAGHPVSGEVRRLLLDAAESA